MAKWQNQVLLTAVLSSSKRNLMKKSEKPLQLLLIPENDWNKVQQTLSSLTSCKNKPNQELTLGGWLNEKQTQALLSRKTTTLWRLRNQGVITYKKLGSATFYLKQSIIDFLNKSEIEQLGTNN